jgi:hypothetical protein
VGNAKAESPRLPAGSLDDLFVRVFVRSCVGSKRGQPRMLLEATGTMNCTFGLVPCSVDFSGHLS